MESKMEHEIAAILAGAQISLTVNLPYKTWDEIRGISVGGLAVPVTDPDEIVRVEDLMLHKFPQVADYAAEAKRACRCSAFPPKPSRSWIAARASGIRNI